MAGASPPAITPERDQWCLPQYLIPVNRVLTVLAQLFLDLAFCSINQSVEALVICLAEDSEVADVQESELEQPETINQW
jgi:hypothetical protein